MFVFQILENIGMMIGLMPVTGITLPFISYGGLPAAEYVLHRISDEHTYISREVSA